MTDISDLELDEATVAILASAGVESAADLADRCLAGTLTEIRGIGAGRAAAIADAVSVWEGSQALAAREVPKPVDHDADPSDGGDLGDPPRPPSDDPASGVASAGPAPVAGPSEVGTPAQGATTYQGRGARYRLVRVRVQNLTEDTRFHWYTREGLAGQVVDAIELVYVPAGRLSPVRVYVYADDEARTKFVDRGGSSRFGHRELAVQSVVE